VIRRTFRGLGDFCAWAVRVAPKSMEAASSECRRERDKVFIIVLWVTLNLRHKVLMWTSFVIKSSNAADLRAATLNDVIAQIL